ncbi:MAG: glycosyltransferase family 2 protein [Acutalibacteraceae bacterium]|nr:glycosyltransferase family 2 protein [Acutalibacteraceae bacterium]
MKPKVSIVTPCYNMESKISMFLDSVIAQNYTPIELILVNDGSTDKTEEVIFSYKQTLLQSGIELKYFYRENSGLAASIGFGIQHVTGDYLMWPDPDDFLFPNSIKSLVDYLEDNSRSGLVRANGWIYDENDLNNPVRKVSYINRKTVLEDFCRFAVPWCAGCYMMRVSALDKANPNRIIFNAKSGQSIQMLLPVVALYGCDYLERDVYGYVIYKRSKSHSINIYEKQKQEIELYKECVEETLKLIESDTSCYLEITTRFLSKSLFNHAWNYREIDEMKRIYKDELQYMSKKEKIICKLKMFLPSNIVGKKIVAVVYRLLSCK